MNLLVLFTRRPAPEVPQERAFRYLYKRHPFDDRQYFFVSAVDQESADILAKEKFVEMFNSGKTTMISFYPV